MRQVIRCRAGVGGQGKPCGDGKPVGPDRSLEKGVGGFKTLGTESQYIDDIPEGDYKQRANLNKRTARRAIFPRNGVHIRSYGDLTSRHQTTGRVRVFAAANTWRTQRPRGASGFGTESQYIEDIPTGTTNKKSPHESVSSFCLWSQQGLNL